MSAGGPQLGRQSRAIACSDAFGQPTRQSLRKIAVTCRVGHLVSVAWHAGVEVHLGGITGQPTRRSFLRGRKGLHRVAIPVELPGRTSRRPPSAFHQVGLPGDLPGGRLPRVGAPALIGKILCAPERLWASRRPKTGRWICKRAVLRVRLMKGKYEDGLDTSRTGRPTSGGQSRHYTEKWHPGTAGMVGT